MKARFRTKCKLCRARIEIGHEIVLRGFGAVHAACDEKERLRDRKITARTAAALELFERAGFR